MDDYKSLEAARSQFALDFDSAIEMLSIMRNRARENGDASSAEVYRKSALGLISALKETMPDYFERGYRPEEYENYEKEFSEQ